MPLKTKCENYIVEYNITEKNLADLPMFGIAVKCGNKQKEINNVFFTKEEAKARCKWLAENQVFPENLWDIMSDILNITG